MVRGSTAVVPLRFFFDTGLLGLLLFISFRNASSLSIRRLFPSSANLRISLSSFSSSPSSSSLPRFTPLDRPPLSSFYP